VTICGHNLTVKVDPVEVVSRLLPGGCVSDLQQGFEEVLSYGMGVWLYWADLSRVVLNA